MKEWGGFFLFYEMCNIINLFGVFCCSFRSYFSSHNFKLLFQFFRAEVMEV